MNLTATFRHIDEEGKLAVTGRIGWNGTRFFVDPPGDMTLLDILQEPIPEPMTGRVLSATKTPVDFMRCLPKQYGSPYFFANLNEEKAENSFCPTGEGGGIDATCSPHASPVHALAEEGLKGLPEEKVSAYREGFHAALTGFPRGAQKRIAANLKTVNFVADLAAVKAEWHQAGGGETGKVAGFCERLPDGSARLVLDGGTDTGEIYDTRDPRIRQGLPSRGVDPRPYSAETMRGIHAHELGHALDGGNREISGSPEWKSAWDREINRTSAPLSRYAATKPHEGFAEYARLVVEDRKTAQEKYPQCWEVWKKRGLVD